MKHTTHKTGGTIVWDKDDFKAGLGPQGGFTLSPNLPYMDANGFANISRIDPFLFYGALTPGYGPGANSTNSSSLVSAIVAMELIDNSTALGVDAGGKIQSLTITSNTISVAGSFPHTIAYASGSGYVGQDGIIYRHNSSGASTVSFFYSAYNSNNWDVGAYVGLSSFDDDFMSTVPASPLDITTGDGDDSTQRTAPHPMEIGADGILYIGSGRYLHAYDGNTGTNGTFSSKVLTLPQGFQIVALKKYQNIFIIVGNYYNTTTGTSTGEALLYTWDYMASDISSVTSLEDFYVSALFIWNGSPTVITNGPPARNGGNKIKVISGNQVTKIADFDGTIPVNRGVVIQNDIIYMNAGGRLLAMGDKYRKSYAINYLNLASASGISGVLQYAELITGFVLSSATAASTAPCINTIYVNNGMGAASCKTFFVNPNFPYDKVGRVRSVIVEYYQELAAGNNGALTMQLITNNSATTHTVISGMSTVSLPLQRKYNQITSGGKLPAFSTIGWQASWTTSTTASSPQICRVEIEYELEELPVTI